jgi:hypothetical protein
MKYEHYRETAREGFSMLHGHERRPVSGRHRRHGERQKFENLERCLYGDGFGLKTEISKAVRISGLKSGDVLVWWGWRGSTG